MSHFYGTLQGQRGEATRTGSKGSGVTTYAASWSGAIRTQIYHNGDTGLDMYRVTQERWHGSGIHEVIAEGVVGQPTVKGLP